MTLNALKVLAVQLAIDNELLPQGTKCYTERWERGKVIENNGKKLFWDWEHSMRTSCKARRPNLTLEDCEKKDIALIDMACPNESYKNMKREEKIRKYQQLCFDRTTGKTGMIQSESLSISDWLLMKRDENIIYIFKKFISNSRGKFKRNECLINVCKSDKDLS
jgi:hypothetical protein